jgi:Chromosome segregation ATPases
MLRWDPVVLVKGANHCSIRYYSIAAYQTVPVRSTPYQFPHQLPAAYSTEQTLYSSSSHHFIQLLIQLQTRPNHDNERETNFVNFIPVQLTLSISSILFYTFLYLYQFVRMDSSSIRKRARTSPALTDSEVQHASVDIIPSAALNFSATNQHLINEIDQLKTELATIKSQRKIDNIQAENNVKRLKRHIVSLEQDAKDANAVVEQIRNQSEHDIEVLLTKKTEASKEAEEWERRYWALREDLSAEGEGGTSLNAKLHMAERKNQVLQEKVTCLEEEVSTLKDKLLEMAKDASQVEQHDDSEPPNADNPNMLASPHPVLSPAPPAVLSELNKTRVKLADSERANRQLLRKVEQLQSQANQMVEYRELSQNAKNKLQNLENELKIVRRERASLRVIEARWIEFRKELVANNLGSQILDGSGEENENMPPEIATLVRHYRKLEDRAREAERSSSMIKIKLDVATNRIEDLEKSNKEINNECINAKGEILELSDKLLKAETLIETTKAKEKIWKRETESIRSLLDTYKAIEDEMIKSKSVSKVESADVSGNETVLKGLKLSLSSAQEEIALLKKQIESAKSEEDIHSAKMNALQDEHENLRSKFMKLRDALFQEREKAEKAEDRAAEAEMLVGKGAFNQESSRVLHLKENPFYKATREKYEKEIEELKSELSEMVAVQKGLVPISAPKSTDPGLDAEKFSKRLKDQFRNHIALFREGVYIITGMNSLL